ncbi:MULTISPECIES: flagellin [Stenotrophomonas]|uniref:flagellin N-terminal helical domain-containing protein n=1 Tax=Stenotrophomonas TaxID=40323 RepID=UPI000D1B790B|nr:flagellin [Stenotrophomonas sp. SMYL86]VUM01204.1 Flagellin [Stenotrophomonas maltophilia]
MAQVINTNTMSLNAQRNLGTSGANMATTIQRLSSGMRINSAKDDAAGLAISERFTTQIRGANQAARNANDGISLAQTAEGALGEIGNNLQRVRELAVQSRSATNSASDRQALNAEVQLLKQEIQRVAEQTNFNGTNLLDGTFTNQAFQIGANQGQTINISQVTNANISKLGNWTTASTDGSLTGGVPNTGTATTSGSFGAFAAPTANGAFTIDVGGVNVYTNADASTATAAAIDTAIAGKTAELAAKGIVASGKAADGDLTFTKADGQKMEVKLSADAAGAFVNGNTVQGTHTSGGFGKASFTLSGSTGSAQIDLTAVGNAGDRATQMVNAVNAQTHNTGVTAALVEGKMQLTDKAGNVTIAVAGTTDAATLTKETGLSEGSSANYAAGKAATGFADLDISSVKGADNAILAMEAALNSINSARADLGAIQNRFTSVVANLNTSSENMSAARSRIRDVDYASETAELTRNQILQQAGTAMLAQANQSSQNVLSLLR